MTDRPDGLVIWRAPAEAVDQLIGWFGNAVRLAPPDSFPEPEKAVLLAGPLCEADELRTVLTAWAAAEPDIPRLVVLAKGENPCPRHLAKDFPGNQKAFPVTASLESSNPWLPLVWLPLVWPFDETVPWVIYRALNNQIAHFDMVPSDMALARRLDMLQKRNLSLAREAVKLRQEAYTCALTGLPNRRAMDRVLARELGHEPLRQPLALALVDIDHFKAWNDRVLHTGGDLLLQGLAQRLRSSLRETDLLARIGGEEFQVLARNSDKEGALALGERLRQHVSESPFDAGGQLVRMTISVGMAAVPAGVRVDPRELAKLAASALQAAKAGGRDRVEVREWVS